MPSTYTTNNGIELIATGEQSGTWGSTTNNNLTFIDTSLDGHLSVTLATAGTSGSPNTLPITDGSSSNGRNRAIIFTDGGDLGADVYVQLTPNDAKKIMFVRNTLSGSRNLILFQGTYNASNDFVLAAGKDAIVKFDGAGAGAVASAVLANLALDAATIGTLAATTVNATTVNATTFDMTNLEVTNIKAKDGTAAGSIADSTGVVTFSSVVLTTADINGGTIDGVSIGNSVAATIIKVDNLSLDGNTIASTDTNGNVVIAPNGTGDVQLDADTVRVGDSNADVTVTTNGTGDLILNTNAGTNSGIIRIYDGASGNIALTPNGTGEVDISKVDIDSGAIDGTVIGGSSAAAGTFTTVTASGNLAVDTNTLFVDAATNFVGIRNATPATTLDVDGTIHASSIIRSKSGGSAAIPSIQPGNDGDTGMFWPGTNTIGFSTAGSERMRITSTGAVGIGTSSPATALDVNGDVTIADKIVHSGDTNTAIRFPAADTVTVETGGTERLRVDSAGFVGIGTSSPQSELDVFGVGDIIRSTSNDAASNFMAFHDATGRKGYVGYGGATDDMTVSNDRSGFLRLLTGGTARIYIDSAGLVGIGNSSPSDRLHVTGNIRTTGKNIFTGTSGQIEVRAGNTVSFLDADLVEATSVDVAARFFRNTNTTGAKSVRFHRGDGTVAEDARISVGTGNTFFGLGGGNVGIGTSSPAALLHVSSSVFTRLRIESTGAATDPELALTNNDGGAAEWTLRLDKDDSNKFQLRYNNSQRLTVDTTGNLLIGGTAAGTASAGNLVLVNGTAPTGNVTNGITLFAEDVSASSELKVRDEAGNVTTLSPHNFDLIPEGPSEEMAWSYYSERDGKRINVDMLKAIRLLEQITGEKLVHIV